MDEKTQGILSSAIGQLRQMEGAAEKLLAEIDDGLLRDLHYGYAVLDGRNGYRIVSGLRALVDVLAQSNEELVTENTKLRELCQEQAEELERLSAVLGTGTGGCPTG